MFGTLFTLAVSLAFVPNPLYTTTSDVEVEINADHSCNYTLTGDILSEVALTGVLNGGKTLTRSVTLAHTQTDGARNTVSLLCDNGVKRIASRTIPYIVNPEMYNSGIVAYQVLISGNPIIGATLTGSYTYGIPSPSRTQLTNTGTFSGGHVEILAIGSGNIPYIIYNDVSGNISIQKWIEESGWTQLGDTFVNGSINNLVLSSDNIPYIVYNNNDGSISIQKWIEESGWTQLGDRFVNGSINNLVLSSDNIPYIRRYDNGETSIQKRIEGLGWTQLGDAFIGGYLGDLLLSSDNIPYIRRYDNGETSIQKRIEGSGWTQLGDTFVNGSINNLVLSSDNIPYIRRYDNGETSIQKRIEGLGWTQLGDTFVNGSINNLVLSSDNIPYIIYNDVSGNISIQKWIEGSGWTQLGDVFVGGKIGNLIIDGLGTLYLRYDNYGSISMQKLVDNTWTYVGQDFTDGTIEEFDLSADDILFAVYYNDNGDVNGDEKPDNDGDEYYHVVKFPQTAAVAEEGTSLYQWYRNDIAIIGATGIAYTLTADDIGALITFKVNPVSPSNAVSPSGEIGFPARSDEFQVYSVPVAQNASVLGTPNVGETLIGNYDASWQMIEATGTNLVGKDFRLISTNDGDSYLSLLDGDTIYVKKYEDGQRKNVSQGLSNPLGREYTFGVLSGNTPYILDDLKLSALRPNGKWITLIDGISQSRTTINGKYLFKKGGIFGSRNFRRLTNGILTDLSAPNTSCEILDLKNGQILVDGIELFVSYTCESDTKFWSLTDSGVWIQINGGGSFSTDSLINTNAGKMSDILTLLYGGGGNVYSKVPIITISSEYSGESVRYFVDNKWIQLPKKPTSILWKNNTAYFNFTPNDNEHPLPLPLQQGKYDLYRYDGQGLALQDQYTHFTTNETDVSTKMFSDKNGNFYIETFKDINDYPGNHDNKIYKFINGGWSQIMDLTSLVNGYDVLAERNNETRKIFGPLPGIDGIQLDENGLPLIGYLEYGFSDGDNGVNTAIVDVYKWSNNHFVKWVDMIGDNTDVDGLITDISNFGSKDGEFPLLDMKSSMEHILSGNASVNIPLAPYIINIDLKNGITAYSGNLHTQVSFDAPIVLEDGVSLDIHSDLPLVLSYQNGHVKFRRFANEQREVFAQETVAIEMLDGIRGFTPLFENDALVITHDTQKEDIAIKGYKNGARSTLVDFGQELPSVDMGASMLDAYNTYASEGLHPLGGRTYNGKIYAMMNDYRVASFGGGTREPLHKRINIDQGKFIGLRMDADKILHFTIEESESMLTTYSFQNGNDVDSLFQWYRDDGPINGATNKTYTTTSQDAGKNLSFIVTPQVLGGLTGNSVRSNTVLISSTNHGTTTGTTTTGTTGSTIGGGGGSTRNVTNGVIGNILHPSASTQTGDITNSPFSTEQNNAYLYAFSLGITTMPTIQQADLKGKIIRSHMAKMIANYATKVLGLKPDTTRDCTFDDVANVSPELQGYITEACQLGLMGVGINNFDPNGGVTRAQLGTILSRALYGNTYNHDGILYYEEHLQALKDHGIITNTNPNIKEIRGYFMLMLYRTKTNK